MVFLFETLSNFDARTDTGRVNDTKEKANIQKEIMRKNYNEFGFSVIEVPEISINKRIEFILDKIKEKN